MKNVLFTLLLLAFAATVKSQTADNISDYDGMVWADYGNTKLVVSENANRLYIVKNDESTAFYNMKITRSGCDITAASDRVFYNLDLTTGNAILTISKTEYYARGNQ